MLARSRNKERKKETLIAQLACSVQLLALPCACTEGYCCSYVPLCSVNLGRGAHQTWLPAYLTRLRVWTATNHRSCGVFAPVAVLTCLPILQPRRRAMGMLMAVLGSAAPAVERCTAIEEALYESQVQLL